MKISASNLIESFKKASFTGALETLYSEVIKLKKDYESNKDKTTLSIQIDTDDDFSVKGKYYGEVVVEGSESYHNALMRYIDDLNIDVKNNSKAKDFIKMLKSESFYNELNSYGYISCGGNQTIDVNIIKKNSVIIFGDLEIDLSK